jgi:hypothetical protein
VRRSVLALRFFEAEEVDVAAGIGDEFVIGNECAAMNFGVARKCHDQCPGLHIPDLQRGVIGGRDGEPPVRTQRNPY